MGEYLSWVPWTHQVGDGIKSETRRLPPAPKKKKIKPCFRAFKRSLLESKKSNGARI